jgi:hypothetical protein
MNAVSARIFNHRLPALMGMAALLAAGSMAWGQQRVGNDGRALDANQQVGSAGYNRVEGRLDYSRGNNIVTGNVGGGRGFQDTVGYRAVGEFDGQLGTDELFGFRASSLSSNPGYLNAASVGGVGPQGNISVYRSFTNRVAQPQGPGLIAPEGGAFQLAPEQSRFTLRGDGFGRLRQEGTVGNLTPGLALQAFSSSPTLGLRGQLMPTKGLSRKLYEAAEESGVLDKPAYLIEPQRYDTGVFDPFGKTKDTALFKDLRPGQVPPTLVIGQQLQTLVDPTSSALEADGRFSDDQVLDSVFRPLQGLEDGTEDDGGGAYLKLLSSIRQNDGAAGETADPGGLDAELEAPTSQQVTEAERAYADIMKKMYGEDYELRRDRSDTAQDTGEDGEGADGEAVRGVVDRLNYDLPRLETLASNKRTRIARLTQEAEAALASGKYLSAESRYRQIILDVQDDPLPRVGLVHAQLGAGMFRSAGMNLRAVLSQHPELIAARYDAKLLPPTSRLQWIQQELQDAISKGEGGKDAPLLMAYLGYQADSRQIVRYGLALAQSKSPRDPLLAVLREIWLDGSDTPSADGE